MKMKKLLLVILMLPLFGIAQLPYTWTSGVNPGWTSSNSSSNTLCYQNGCYKTVSTSNCTGSGWNTYNNSQITSYTSPSYSFICSTNINVTINLDINLESSYDWLYFQYSLNGGTTWINPVISSTITNGSGINLSVYTPLTISGVNNNRNGWTGSVGVVNITYSIPSSLTTKFRFIFESDGSVNSYVSSGNTYIYYADILGFSVTCPSVLPIELLYFNSEKSNCNVNNLSWSTATETNNDHFDIERSIDGIDFTKIKEIKGSINSLETKTYSCIDTSPINGMNYYRLKQVDLDGNYTYSSIIDSDNSCINTLKVSKICNLLGQEVTDDFDGPRIIYYSDGTVIKKIGK